MEKVICDVCGVGYPETADQCPICGCARAGSGSASAGHTAGTEENGGYTYTKGGRFSKANVRKRLKAAQIQPVPVEIPVRTPDPESHEDYDEYDDYDDDEMDDEPTSNRGLIVIVALLLVAIIAVASYIAVVHFDIFGDGQPTTPVATTAPTKPSTDPTEFTGVRVPCTGLTADTQLTLVELGGTMQLSFNVEPIDTTDSVQFASSNLKVVKVDSTGRVTAVGNGKAIITITCGDFFSECTVTCILSGGDKPVDPTDPTLPSEPSEPTIPDPVVELKLNRTDFTLTKKGTYHNVYSGELDPAEITWTSKNEAVATVTNGKVVAVGNGRTEIVAEYKGQTASCWVSCRWTEVEPEPTDPVDPSEPDNPDTPDTPAEPQNYFLRIDGSAPVYQYNNQPNSADVSLKVNKKFRLTIVQDAELEKPVNDVVWTFSDDTVCAIDGNAVTGLKKGNCTITAEYQGITFVVYVRVSE